MNLLLKNSCLRKMDIAAVVVHNAYLTGSDRERGGDFVCERDRGGGGGWGERQRDKERETHR